MADNCVRRMRRNGLRMAVLIAGLLAMVGARAAITVDSVRLHRAPDHTRIVFDLPEPVEHTLDKLADPDRVVVDLMDADLAFDVSALDYKDSPIENIRVGKHEDKTRVVFDLSAAVRPRTNLLKPVDPHSWRLVVDLFDSDPKPVKTIEEPEADMKAVMVRDGDYYVPLAERRRVARQDNHADVFISIHADAFTDPRAHGASVFALSNRGATSARAAYVAKMANESDKVAGVYEEEKDDSNLLNVLADMRMSGSMAHSLYLGRQILEEMGQITKLHGGRKTVEQAAFVVLKEPEMVSVLVETGFISNREEARNLSSSAHQEKLARSIVNGVKHYFRTHPAPGSWFAAQRRENGEQHRIQPGDTLSGIARQYQVSEQALRAANDIRDDRIMVGQTLTIPRS